MEWSCLKWNFGIFVFLLSELYVFCEGVLYINYYYIYCIVGNFGMILCGN